MNMFYSLKAQKLKLQYAQTTIQQQLVATHKTKTVDDDAEEAP